MLRWIKERNVDVIALQETKLQNTEFPRLEVEAACYAAVFSGQKSYNGVALLSRHKAEDVVTEVAGTNHAEKRVLAATVGSVRIINLYVINGRSVDAEDYRLKLDWLAAVTTFIASELKRYEFVLVVGDFNIAPTDNDVHDPQQWQDKILCSTAERNALNTLLGQGLIDTFRLFEHAEECRFSWWHYRQGGFARNQGLRIDLILASRALAEHCHASIVDCAPRGWDRPSDHAPALATFKLPPLR